MRVWPSRDAKRAKSEEDKLWYAAGIPYRFWNDTLGHIRFKVVKDEEALVTPQQQQEVYDELYNHKSWTRPNLIAIGSVPTDKQATVLAVRIVKEALKANRRITMQDMGYSNITETSDDSVIYMGYNILPEMTVQRRVRVRDWLEYFSDRLRILVMAGDPMQTMMHTLRMEPNAVIYVDSSNDRKLSLV